MNYNDETLKKLIFDSIEKDSVLKLVFSAPIFKNEEEISKYSIKPLMIKDKIVYQVEYFKNNKAYHINCEKSDVYSEVLSIYKNFKNLNLFTDTCEYSILFNKDNVWV